MVTDLQQTLVQLQAQMTIPAIVFIRVAAAMFLIPGFGERSVPLRLRLVLAVAFTMVTWPLAVRQVETGWPSFSLRLILSESVVGLAMGVFFRLFVQMLEMAGTIAAQTMSLSQLFGAGPGQDPMPAIGNLLVVSGIALAMIGGLHIKLAVALAESYRAFPPGVIPSAGDLSQWGVRGVAGAFYRAFALAGPFVLLSLIYNIALGAVNRAMPQMMVAFIGAPAITLAALVLLAVTSVYILSIWAGRLDAGLFNPFGDIW